MFCSCRFVDGCLGWKNGTCSVFLSEEGTYCGVYLVIAVKVKGSDPKGVVGSKDT